MRREIAGSISLPFDNAQHVSPAAGGRGDPTVVRPTQMT